MSIILEPPAHPHDGLVSLEGDAAETLTACARCPQAGTCRIAAGLTRLARIRERMVPNANNMWLRGRIDEYLGIQVCLAGVFGMGPAELAEHPPAPAEQDGGHRSITLEIALRHRAALFHGDGPTGLDRLKPGERFDHALEVRAVPQTAEKG